MKWSSRSELDAMVQEIVERPAAGRPASPRPQRKDLIRAVAGQPVNDDAGRRHRAPHRQPARHAGSPEGIAAFLEKRKPDWVSAFGGG